MSQCKQIVCDMRIIYSGKHVVHDLTVPLKLNTHAYCTRLQILVTFCIKKKRIERLFKREHKISVEN